MNLGGNVVHKPGPSYVDDPQGLVYKPNQAHHLALYHDVDLDDDAAKPQDSPFLPDDSYPGAHGPYGRIDINDNQYSNSTASTSPHSDEVRHQMKGVNEIEYATAVTPIDHVTMDESSVDNGSMSSSGAPSEPGSLSTYRASSTQKLVTPRGTPKGTLKKQSGVSFIEDGGGYVIPQVRIINHNNIIQVSTPNTFFGLQYK